MVAKEDESKGREDDGYEYNGCFVRWMKSLYA